MTPEALLEALLALAAEVGLKVQRVGRQPAFEGLSPSSSAACTVRGEVRVLLADSDPVPARVAALAGALRAVAGEHLEARFLPPAVRACLEEAPPAPHAAATPAQDAAPDAPAAGAAPNLDPRSRV